MRGRLSEFNLGEILQLFALSEKSGTVTVTHSGGRSRVMLEAGRVVGWGLEDFDLHAAILKCEFLSPSSRSAIESIEPDEGTPGLGFVLRNLIDPGRWTGFIQRLLEQDIYEILDVENGDFDIEVGRIPPVPVALDLSVQQLILDGSRWQADSAVLASEGFTPESRWARNGDLDADEQLELSSLDWLVVAALSEPRELMKIGAAICQPDLDTADAVRGLSKRNFVRREASGN